MRNTSFCDAGSTLSILKIGISDYWFDFVRKILRSPVVPDACMHDQNLSPRSQ